MADDDVEDTHPSASRPFFIRGGFPFVFLPTTFATDFSSTNNHTRVSSNEDEVNTESRKKKVNDENQDERKTEEQEDEIENVDNVEADCNTNGNDDVANEKNDLRISQTKYSQLLRELDFSKTRMVDVTNMLNDELEEEPCSPTADGNKDKEKVTRKTEYESSSSSEDDADSDNQMSSNKSDSADSDASEEQKFKNAVHQMENEIDDLAAMIHAAAHVTHGQDPEDSTNNLQKRPTIDEDDDTSKQATQNYDFNDFEQEENVSSPKAVKIPRVINIPQSDAIQHEAKSSTVEAVKDTNRNAETSNKINEQQQPTMDWSSLVNGDEPPAQTPEEQVFPRTKIDPYVTPKRPKDTKVSILVEETPQPFTDISSQRTNRHQPQRTLSSSSSSSATTTDTDSVIQHPINQPKSEHPSSPPQPKPSPALHNVFPSKTLRQDSQETLIDANPDELNSQVKQSLEKGRPTYNSNIKEERTADGINAASIPSQIADAHTANEVHNQTSTHLNDNIGRYSSKQARTNYQQYSMDLPEYASSPRRPGFQYSEKNPASSRYFERQDETNTHKRHDDWLNMLGKLEHEHKERLERQQQQYESTMHNLEEKMKRRFDDYLTLTNGFQESRLDDHDNDAVRIYPTPSSVPIDSNIGRYKEHTQPRRHRLHAKDLISHYYPADSTLNILTTEQNRKPDTNYASLSRSREDIANLRTELAAIHAKHIADLKLYYEYEINELKNQLNRARMGQSSSNHRQSADTIERINSENIRRGDGGHKDLRHSLKAMEDENNLLKRQLEDLREQMNNKDLDLKNYHHTIVDLEKQLAEAENTKERHDEKYRHADRQALLYREENEKIKTDLNLTRERLLRLEERCFEQENENELLRRQLFMLDNDANRLNNRAVNGHSSTMNMNQPTSRDYGRFALTQTKPTPPTMSNRSRERNTDSQRYNPNDIENALRHANSPRPMTRISDYLNEKPVFPPPYVPPTRRSYSPRKLSPNRRRVEPARATSSSTDRHRKQSEQLELKFDQLLRKKRDLETRLSRIPTRGLTNIDRQLYEVLEREIERVEEQLSSVKLELRKLTIFRTS